MKWREVNSNNNHHIYPIIHGYEFLCKDVSLNLFNYKFTSALAWLKEGQAEFYLPNNELMELEMKLMQEFCNDDLLIKNLAVKLEQEMSSIIEWLNRISQRDFENIDNVFLHNYLTRFSSMYALTYSIAIVIDVAFDKLNSYLYNHIKEICEENNNTEYIDSYYQTLVEPSKKTLIALEEVDLYKLAKILVSIMDKNKISLNNVLQVNSVRELIDEHIKNHNWILFNYFEQFWQRDDFIKRLRDIILLGEGKIDQQIKISNNLKDQVAVKQEKIHQTLNLDEKAICLFKHLQEMSLLLKRKKQIFNDIDNKVEALFSELAMRINIPRKLLNLLESKEIASALLENKQIDKEAIKERFDYSVWQVVCGKIIPHYNQSFEQIEKLFS